MSVLYKKTMSIDVYIQIIIRHQLNVCKRHYLSSNAVADSATPKDTGDPKHRQILNLPQSLIIVAQCHREELYLCDLMFRWLKSLWNNTSHQISKKKPCATELNWLCCSALHNEGAGWAAGTPQITPQLSAFEPPAWLLKHFIYSSLKLYHKLFFLLTLF